MKIRKAKKSDLERIQKIIFAALGKLRLKPGLRKKLNEDYTLENLEKARRKIGMFVSENKKVVQGCGRLEKDRELRMIYVNPGYQRRGFGSAMIKRLESLARRKGMKKVHIKALSPAIGFYRKLGYSRVKKEKDSTIRMEKMLK